MTEISTFLPKLFGPQVMTLLALIVAQVLLAVAEALKTGQFDWKRLPDFYKTMVLPLLLGWVALTVLVHFAAPAALGDVYGGLTAESVTWLAWSAVVGCLASKIIESVKTLYGSLLPLKQ